MAPGLSSNPGPLVRGKSPNHWTTASDESVLIINAITKYHVTFSASTWQKKINSNITLLVLVIQYWGVLGLAELNFFV